MPRAKKPVAVTAETPDAAFHDEASKLVKTLSPLLKGQRHGVIVSAFAFLMWDAGYAAGRQEGMAIKIASHLATAMPSSIPMDGIEEMGEEELDVPAPELKPKKNQIN